MRFLLSAENFRDAFLKPNTACTLQCVKYYILYNFILFILLLLLYIITYTDITSSTFFKPEYIGRVSFSNFTALDALSNAYSKHWIP